MARTVKVRLGINGHASAMIVSRHMTTIQTGTITIYDVPDNISNYDLILLINKQVEGLRSLTAVTYADAFQGTT